MDIDFMRNQNVELLPIERKPNFNLMRQNFYLAEDRKFIIMSICSLVIVLITALIK